MLSNQKILVHEDYHKAPLAALVVNAWKTVGLNMKLPSFEQPALGTLQARGNNGRWVIECPARRGGALLASNRDRYFICPNCGSDGGFYDVEFPDDRADIEEVLLRRPAVNSLSASHRNWRPGETVSDLVRENQEHGLD